MFQYQEKVNAGVPQLCTPEKWDELMSAHGHYLEGETYSAWDENGKILKNNKRVSADAVPSGLAMLDVDHVEKPREWWDSLMEIASTEHLKKNGIYLIAITASGKGLRVIGRRQKGESIEAAQLRIASVLGITEYDAVTKDLARASYVVPREYVLYEDREGLFNPNKAETPDSIRQNGRSLLALPAHVETAEYRGIPYSAIVQQLMLSIGAADGAEQGERNTVYFSLACYMRYICDFDAALLLRVLPGFGLGEQERRQAIASAIGRPRKSEMPMVL